MLETQFRGGHVEDHTAGRRMWIVIAVKIFFGVVIVVGIGNMAQRYLDWAGDALDNAHVAVAHAAADGRAPTDRYVAIPGIGPIASPPGKPAFPAVPRNDAASAVVADQTIAAFFMSESSELQTTARWIMTGAGVVGLLMLRNVLADISKAAREA
jgi:hypothetical protein